MTDRENAELEEIIRQLRKCHEVQNQALNNAAAAIKALAAFHSGAPSDHVVVSKKWLTQFRYAIKSNDSFASKEIALNWLDEAIKGIGKEER